MPLSTSLPELSQHLADLVAGAGTSAVAVHGHARFSASGLLWRSGEIVTASCTLRRDEEIDVTLADGRRVTALLVGRDPGTDLALLRVEESTPPAAFSSSAGLRPGNLALAIGRSENAGVTASFGMLSAVSGPWRTWRGGRMEQYVRLDITLYPGSAGAAVFDTEGRLLGIATPGLSRTAPLLIPVATIERVTAALSSMGRVQRGYLGISLQPLALPEAMQKDLGRRQEHGLMLLSVEAESPAQQAGLLLGDILAGVDGTPVQDPADLHPYLDSDGIGRTLRLELIRGGARREAAVTVAARG